MGGLHLDGIYGQTAVHNRALYDNVIISFFDDRLLPREAGSYSLQSEESGTESVYAIYAEGVAQQAPRTWLRNGTDIVGSVQFANGKPDELVVYGVLPLGPDLPTPLPGQDYILQGNTDTNQHGLWRMGAEQAVGVSETFSGIAASAVFQPASDQSIFVDGFEI